MRIKTTYLDGIAIHTKTYEPSDYSTAEQKSAWQNICNSCEFKQDDRCSACGCLFEALMTLSDAKCPLNKW
jgi:hypothetical protein